MNRKAILSLVLVPVGALWSQTAPTGLTVVSATNKQVSLSWQGTAPAGFSVERRLLGGTYTQVVLVPNGTTFTDTQFDPMGAYQYRVRATSTNGVSDPSGEVTVGAPAPGFALLSPTPDVIINGPAGPAAFGRNAMMILDTNGDPAYAYLVSDPRADGTIDATELWFKNWNRAAYRWNPDVKVAVTGDVANAFHSPMSLAQDASTKGWGIACEESPTGNIVVYLSADGVNWTRKVAVPIDPITDGASSPSLGLAGGNLHLGYLRYLQGAIYVTGKQSDDPAKWTSKVSPVPAGTAISNLGVTVSLALDSNQVAAISYFLTDTNNDYNRVLAFWRTSSNAAVRVTDTNGYQSDGVDVRLTYSGAQPRILLNAQRDGSFSGRDTYVTKSDNGGTSWQAPAAIPTDGGSYCIGPPFDLALDSKGGGAVVFDRNCGSGDDTCWGVKLSRSSDLVNWTTCAIALTPDDLTLDPSYASAAARFAVNDKLYVLWQQTSQSPIGQGLVLWREP